MDKKTESLEAVEKMLKERQKMLKEGRKKMRIQGLFNFFNPPSKKEAIRKKGTGGDLKTEYRGGGMVNLGNYKGQF